MARKRRVAFARINRRNPAQVPIQNRSFRDEMTLLAESQETKAVLRGVEWIASDLKLDPSGDFMTGILGFAEEDVLREFDAEAFSWLKGPMRTEFGASERTMVPFAVDLREDHRWVAFATAHRIRPPGFVNGLKATLNNAVTNIGLRVPLEWDVDLVPDVTTLERWIEEHPDITVFVRDIYLHNPGRDIEDDRKEMRALAARVKEEKFTAYRGQRLRLEGPEFEEKLDGIDTGDARIRLRTASHETFNSDENTEVKWIDDYRDDLEAGIERVLSALVAFVQRRRDRRNERKDNEAG